jgi:hypothetical protein
MLALKLDLSDDHGSPGVVDPPSHDLLVERSPSSESNIFWGDLEKAGSFCRVQKIVEKWVFLHLR